MQPSDASIVKTEGNDSAGLAGLLGDSFACAVLIVDRKERITGCTLAAEKLLRLEPGQAIRSTIAILEPGLQKLIRDCFVARHPLASRTLPLPNTQGNLSAAAALLHPRPDSEVVVSLNDLTSLRFLEKNLGRLDRLANVGTFSAGMAHEIKNALVAVKTFVDLLLEKGDDEELAQTVDRELRRMSGLVGQMLRFAAPPKVRFERIHIHEVIDHSLRMVQSQIDHKMVSLERKLNASPDLIRGDDYQLEQALLNLLINAIEAIGPNGVLSIRTDIVPRDPAPSFSDAPAAPKDNRRIRVSIQDSGVGIKAEYLARMFEPFFTTKENGTGLGLPICQRIIQDHHGSITVESQLHRGTTFHIHLPLFGHER